MNMNEVPIEVLCASWLDAKREEEAAAERRKAIAAGIVAALAYADPEGTDRREVGGFKLAVTHKLTRSVDKKLADDWGQLPAMVQASFRWKPDLDLKNLRALEFANPEAYKVAAKYISAKPATPSIAIEVA